MKAILGRYVQIGDTIDAGRGHRGKVLKHLYDDSGGRCLELDIGRLSFLSGDIVGLVRRPYPPGKTEQDMLADIDAAICDAWLGRVTPEEGRAALLKAIEAHELGKPLDEDSGGARRGWIDKHMTP